jgi:hypothetical protein
MNNVFSFYKTAQNRWFYDWPDYERDHNELEMIDGADTLLEHFAHDSKYVNLIVDTIKKRSHYDFILKKNTVEAHGCYYTCDDLDYHVYLCSVMLLIYEDYPDVLYVTVAD